MYVGLYGSGLFNFIDTWPWLYLLCYPPDLFLPFGVLTSLHVLSFLLKIVYCTWKVKSYSLYYIVYKKCHYSWNINTYIYIHPYICMYVCACIHVCTCTYVHNIHILYIQIHKYTQNLLTQNCIMIYCIVKYFWGFNWDKATKTSLANISLFFEPYPLNCTRAAHCYISAYSHVFVAHGFIPLLKTSKQRRTTIPSTLAHKNCTFVFCCSCNSIVKIVIKFSNNRRGLYLRYKAKKKLRLKESSWAGSYIRYMYAKNYPQLK